MCSVLQMISQTDSAKQQLKYDVLHPLSGLEQREITEDAVTTGHTSPNK